MIKPKSNGSSSLRNAAILSAVVAVLYFAHELLIPLAFAITFSLILTPAMALLRRIRIGRVPAALLLIVIAMAAAGGIAWVIFNQLIEVASQLPAYQDNIDAKIAAVRTSSKAPWERPLPVSRKFRKRFPPRPRPPQHHRQVLARGGATRRGRLRGPSP